MSERNSITIKIPLEGGIPQGARVTQSNVDADVFIQVFDYDTSDSGDEPEGHDEEGVPYWWSYIFDLQATS